VPKAAVVAVAPAQTGIPIEAAQRWADDRGIALLVFVGWESFVRQVVWWMRLPAEDAIRAAYTTIHSRLIALEASREAIDGWSERALSESAMDGTS
jgi:hypothetical protein